MELRSGGSGFRRCALLAAAAVLAFVVAAVAAGAEPMTTPLSTEPGTPPTAAPPLCVRISCAASSSVSVDPESGIWTTVLTVSGTCGVPIDAVRVLFRDTLGGSATWQGHGPEHADLATGSFAHDPASFESFLPGLGPIAPSGVVYFTGWCSNPATGRRFMTPPAAFCLYAPNDDPAGCTATIGPLVYPLGAGAFLGEQFIGQIGEQFSPAAPAPTPDAPATTPTTRRKVVSPTAPPATEPVTSPTAPPVVCPKPKEIPPDCLPVP